RGIRRRALGGQSEMSQSARYQVVITATGERTLKDLLKKRGHQAIEQVRVVIQGLEEDPEQKTQPLTGMLAGFRSLHSGRFRIVIRIVHKQVRVYIVGVGWHAS